MAGYFTESNYENAVLQLLNEELGYNYIYGPDVERVITRRFTRMFCYLPCNGSTRACLWTL